jgi:hypothetical protein
MIYLESGLKTVRNLIKINGSLILKRIIKIKITLHKIKFAIKKI